MRQHLKWATRLAQIRRQIPIWIGRLQVPSARFAAKASGAALADLLFPPHCRLCGCALESEERHFCRDCHHKLIDSPISCPRCAKPLPSYTTADPSGCLLCKHRRFRYQRTVALGCYGGAIRELVLRMKQARHESLSLAAGELLAQRLAFEWAAHLPDIVIPVPMHWYRRLRRGVNDAELMGVAIARQLDVPLRLGLVHCRRRTRKQGTLTPTERPRNVRQAFGVSRRVNLTGVHVLVVDDVMTTGATANEIARMLRQRGARDISVAVIARGVGYD